MKKIGKIFNKIYIFFVAFVCLFGIMIFFISSSNLTKKLEKYLHILPSFNGGILAQEVYDKADDDNGSGNLVYPSNSQFEAGALDLVHYAVYNPVHSAKWQQNSEYWQLVLDFKAGAENIRNIMIYIDFDNVSGGSTSPLFDAAENVEFDSAHPWDFAVWICDLQGKVYNSQGQFLCNTEYYTSDGGKTVKIRIPLLNKSLQMIYASGKTYHYVLAGGYSPLDRGGFMPIEKRRSVSRGGTKSARDYNALIPKVYDILGDNQCLGSWDAQNFTKAKVSPVEIKMNPLIDQLSGSSGKISTKASQAQEDEAFIQKVIQDYSGQMTAFNEIFDKTAESKANLAKKLEENPQDYVSMAYYGSCLAAEGGQSSVLQAVALVNESFEYLDKAAELARDKPGEIDVLMNRAIVCYSVPNDVFEKTETGVQDFMRIIELCGPDDVNLKVYCYVMASKCYKTLGKETEAVLVLQEAKSLIQ